MYARRHVVPFDSLSWKTTVTDCMSADDIASEPKEEIYIKGLPVEGGRWDPVAKRLTECGQKYLMNYLPVMHLSPIQDKKLYEKERFYECPVFHTQNRGT